MTDNQLVELFHSCDKKGTGQIGPTEFRTLCSEFDIGASDSDAIFADLDHDGDGQITLEDFAWGFRDFLNPRQGVQDEMGELQGSIGRHSLQRRQSYTAAAWTQLVEGVGQPAIMKFLNTSGKKLEDLYHQLQTTGTCPELVTQFEGTVSSLLQDIKRLCDDNKKLELMFTREKETHMERLQSLEVELDAQMAKVEAEAREEARRKFEQEKREILESTRSEIMELKTHLRLFQKVNDTLAQKKEGSHDVLNTAYCENEELKTSLSDTKATLAVLHAEMSRLKKEYEDKCNELRSQHEAVIQYVDHSKHIQNQLSILHETNKSLQDTNDHLIEAMGTSGRNTPFAFSKANSETSSGTGSVKTDTLSRSRNSILPDMNDSSGAYFTIKRFMDDLDSGRSTMRECVDGDSDKRSLMEEMSNSDLESQFKSFDSEESFRDHRYLSSPSPYHRGHQLARSVSYDPDGPPERTFKIVFAGDAAVGKSSFIHRFCKGTFEHKLGSTLGVDFQVKTIRVDEKNVTLQLWDTAGQERFRSITKAYFRKADGILLMYDTTSERSFLNVRQWVQSIAETTDRQIPIMICGNKTDLREKAKEEGIKCVTQKCGENLAKEYDAVFYETSSKTGENLLDALVCITREMLLKEDVEVQTSALQVTAAAYQKSSCCKKM